MKRTFCFLMAGLLMLSLWGCKNGSTTESAGFYYPRVKYEYGTCTEDGVIRSEQRDITGHSDELSFLISLYLMGPQEENLCSAFPADTRVLSAKITYGNVQIELSDTGDALSDSQFSLACACLTLTCLDLTTASSVTITSGGREITLARGDLTLYDDVTVNETTTEASQ